MAPTLPRKSGVILNLGSISWHLGLPDLSIYETAKAGIEGMTRALARELGPSRKQVQTLRRRVQTNLFRTLPTGVREQEVEFEADELYQNSGESAIRSPETGRL